MNLNNSIQFLQSLSSEYRGPRALCFAGNGGGGEQDPPEGEVTPPEGAPPEGEQPPEGTPPEGTPPPEGEIDQDDPLVTPNPYDEGSDQHKAFENQRQKMAKKLESAVAKARQEAEAAALGKIGEIIEQKMGTKAPPAPETPPATPPAEKPKATQEDVEIIRDGLRAIGIDPDEMVRERRRMEVNAAVEQLRKEYPGVTFDPIELVKFTNEAGLNAMPGTIYDKLEMGLLKKQKDTLKKGATPPPATPPATPKKPAVPVLDGGANGKPLPKEAPATVSGWRAKILGKRGAK